MREIKFRAWCEERKEMWTWEELCGTGKNAPHAHPLTCLCSGAGWWVMQYIGLNDKKGKKIYEGDIVLVGRWEPNDDGDEEFEGSKHTVKYCADVDYPAFDLVPHLDCDSNGISYCLGSGEEQILVIGNIYENPELLK